jgi:hypothetical protein
MSSVCSTRFILRSKTQDFMEIGLDRPVKWNHLEIGFGDYVPFGTRFWLNSQREISDSEDETIYGSNEGFLLGNTQGGNGVDLRSVHTRVYPKFSKLGR